MCQYRSSAPQPGKLQRRLEGIDERGVGVDELLGHAQAKPDVKVALVVRPLERAIPAASIGTGGTDLDLMISRASRTIRASA